MRAVTSPYVHRVFLEDDYFRALRRGGRWGLQQSA